MRAATVASAIIAITVALGLTANAEIASFSIAPVRSTDGGAFFSYTLGPGMTVTDAAVVRNDAAAPITLRFYAADAITATNGGTAFAAYGQFRDHTHTWLAATIESLTLPAHTSTPVPFLVTVPKDATAGDHIAGWVVEAGPQQTNAGGFAAAVVQRAGVAVVVHVPGKTIAKLALGEVCLNQQSGSNYFQLVASNQGDVLTKATGDLALRVDGGPDLFRRAIDIGTVLPHDSAFVRLDAPIDPGPGRFVASIRLTTSDGNASALDAPIVVGKTKANGCAKADAAPAPLTPTRTTAQVAPQGSAASTSSGPLGGALPAVLAGGVGLLVGAAAIWVLRKP